MNKPSHQSPEGVAAQGAGTAIYAYWKRQQKRGILSCLGDARGQLVQYFIHQRGNSSPDIVGQSQCHWKATPGPEPRAGLLVQNTFLLHHSCFSTVLRFCSFPYSNANILCALYFFTNWSLLYRVNEHRLAMSKWSVPFKTLFFFCLNFWHGTSFLPIKLALLALGDATSSKDEVTEINRPEESLPYSHSHPYFGKWSSKPVAMKPVQLGSVGVWVVSQKLLRLWETREVVCLPIITPMRINMINMYLQIIYHLGEVGTAKWALHCNLIDSVIEIRWIQSISTPEWYLNLAF